MGKMLFYVESGPRVRHFETIGSAEKFAAGRARKLGHRVRVYGWAGDLVTEVVPKYKRGAWSDMTDTGAEFA